MTAELSSAFPYNGGYSLWVKAAFGKFWGVQESYWSWVSGVVDNAVYPVIIFQTISNVAPDSFGAMSAGLAWLFKAALCVIFSIPMLFSIKVTEGSFGNSGKGTRLPVLPVIAIDTSS
mmetsp:Transcript_5079/g.4320  ORF Transcript_5079/g.4320 Transcript_5079/m.4320 type:complete len:118 (-) Transcript_5079:28-381(-)